MVDTAAAVSTSNAPEQIFDEYLRSLQQYGLDAMDEPTRSQVAKGFRSGLREITTPFQITMQQLANVYSLSSLRTLCKTGVLQQIPSDAGISIDQLASKSNVSSALLRRLLRLLIVTGFLREDEEGNVLHTRLSSEFAQSPEMTAMLDVLAEHTFLSLGRLPEYLEEQGADKEPDDQRLNPYTWSRGKNGTSVWKVMEENGELWACLGLRAWARAWAQLRGAGFVDELHSINWTHLQPCFLGIDAGFLKM